MPSTTVSIAALERALASTRRQLESLQTRRAKLIEKVARLDRQIDELEGRPSTGVGPKGRLPARKARKAGGRRPSKKRTSLMRVVLDVLAKAAEPMGIKEIAAAVVASGYKSKSKDLTGLISSQIYRHKEIKRPKRGKFLLKPDAAKAKRGK